MVREKIHVICVLLFSLLLNKVTVRKYVLNLAHGLRCNLFCSNKDGRSKMQLVTLRPSQEAEKN